MTYPVGIRTLLFIGPAPAAEHALPPLLVRRGRKGRAGSVGACFLAAAWQLSLVLGGCFFCLVFFFFDCVRRDNER